MTHKYPGGFVTLTPPTQDPALGAATPGIWTLDQALNAEVTRSWPMYDPYYKNVVLNLHGEGTNGAQNNTFLDSSTNNFTITRNGNTTQGTFSPYGNYWSNYFGGSGNYLTLPSNSAFNLGTGAYTVEAWVYLTSYAANEMVVFCNGNANGAIACSILTSGEITISKYGTGSIIVGSVGDIQLNRWNHIAYVRTSTASNATKLYVNGDLRATGTDSNDWNVITTPTIGGLTIAGYGIFGNLSNVRVVKGTAVYTSTFTPSTAPLTNITNTSLLTCQNNRFVDNSTNAFAITTTGSPSVQRFQPFLFNTSYTPSTIGGSGYFDGTGDMLQTPSITIGTNNFCFECWLYPTATQGATTGIFVGTTSSSLQAAYYGSSGLGIATAGVAWQLFETTNLPIVNAWNHVAFVRSSTGTNQTSIYLNGVRVANGTVASNFAASVYQLSTTNAGGTVFQGYITDARLTNGSTPYDATQSTITIPTAPLTTSASNTVLLLSMTNGAIYDNAMMNDLETVGNAQISTSVKKYGTGSMYFDGTGDYLTAPNSPQFALGSGDFTLEAWVYTASAATNQTICAKETSGSDSFLFLIGNSSGNKAALNLSSDGASYSLTLAGTTTLSTNTWYHIAAVRSGSGSNNVKLYLNGTQEAQGTFSGTVYNDTSMFTVGYRQSASNLYFNGYIDDLRVTKGVARYVANFTPPTSQLQDQ